MFCPMVYVTTCWSIYDNTKSICRWVVSCKNTNYPNKDNLALKTLTSTKRRGPTRFRFLFTRIRNKVKTKKVKRPSNSYKNRGWKNPPSGSSCSNEKIVDFVKALCKVYMGELQSTSTPQVFRLTKIVEIVYASSYFLFFSWNNFFSVVFVWRDGMVCSIADGME